MLPKALHEVKSGEQIIFTIPSLNPYKLRKIVVTWIHKLRACKSIDSNHQVFILWSRTICVIFKMSRKPPLSCRASKIGWNWLWQNHKQHKSDFRILNRNKHRKSWTNLISINRKEKHSINSPYLHVQCPWKSPKDRINKKRNEVTGNMSTYISICSPHCPVTQHLGNPRSCSPRLGFAFPGPNNAWSIIQVRPAKHFRPSPKPIASPYRPWTWAISLTRTFWIHMQRNKNLTLSTSLSHKLKIRT
jgi:hypothetical protein